MDQDVIEAMLIAIEDDNPDAEVLYEDHGGYVRIHTPWLRRVTRKSLAATLGRSFRLVDLEPSLSGFAGRMRYVGDDALEWHQAADELRRIQWLAYRAKSLSLERDAELASSAKARQCWEEDQAWQPLRETVEKMLSPTTGVRLSRRST
jgi:toluene monooxygenase system protein D